MISPIAKDVMIDVKMLTNPKKFYRVKNCIELTSSRDIDATIAGCQRPLIKTYAVEINNIKENVAILLQTLKNKCVINVDPAQQDISLVREQLEQVLADLRGKMKQSYDEVIGLVVGGRAYDINNKFADKGIQLTDAICEFMEAEHIPSTKLLEQNLGRNTKGIDVYTNRNDAVLSGGIIDKFVGTESNTKDEIQAIGEQMFDIFEVSPHAPISIVDKIAPAQGTNTRFL